MARRPFRVERCRDRWHTTPRWVLRQRRGDRYIYMDCFPSQGSAIDHAHKNWPWWP